MTSHVPADAFTEVRARRGFVPRFRAGPDWVGWVSFDVGRIACPVVAPHGTEDSICPVAHARYTASIVPGARLEAREGLGHFSIIGDVLPTLAAMA